MRRPGSRRHPFDPHHARGITTDWTSTPGPDDPPVTIPCRARRVPYRLRPASPSRFSAGLRRRAFGAIQGCDRPGTLRDRIQAAVPRSFALRHVALPVGDEPQLREIGEFTKQRSSNLKACPGFGPRRCFPFWGRCHAPTLPNLALAQNHSTRRPPLSIGRGGAWVRQSRATQRAPTRRLPAVRESSCQPRWGRQASLARTRVAGAFAI